MIMQALTTSPGGYLKSNKLPRIIFRADGNSQVGLGHIYRLIALVQQCSQTFECIFISKEPSTSLIQLIAEHCPLVSVNDETEWQVLENILLPSDLFVLDGYDFSLAYHQRIASKVNRLIIIDDTAERPLYADLIINHGGEKIRDRYLDRDDATLLTGFSYTILRKEFLQAASSERMVSKVDTMFICMGGADPFNITTKAIEAGLQTSFISTIIVVTGSAYSHYELLERILASPLKGKTIIHRKNIPAGTMVDLIQTSEIAICPSSSIALEVCCVKAGLITGTVIENQSSIHQQIMEGGCGISVGDFNTVSVEGIKLKIEQLKTVEAINRFMQNQAKAIDGHSGERLVEHFKTMAAC